MASVDSPSDAPSLTELVIEVSDTSYPFVGISRAEDCRFDLTEMLPRSEGRYAEFFSVTSADPDRVLARVERDDRVTPRLLDRHEDGGLFEFVASDGCPVVFLVERGAIPQEVVGDAGDGRIVVEIPASEDAGSVASAFLDTYPSAELAAKRTLDRSTPLLGRSELERAVESALTDRQREVLTTAYERGYYDQPRRVTGEELAAELDISPSTFAQHVRAAERNLLTLLTDGKVL